MIKQLEKLTDSNITEYIFIDKINEIIDLLNELNIRLNILDEEEE